MPRTFNHHPNVCVVFPFWSQSDALNWDSNYVYLRKVLPPLADLLPSYLFIVLWPRKSKGIDAWKYHDDGLFLHERIRPYPWPFDTSMRSSVLGFDVEAYYDIERRYEPTLYWLHQVESGCQVFAGFNQAMAIANRPALLAQHHYVIHKSLPYEYTSLFPRLWLQIGGTIASDRVVLNSAYTKRLLVESYADLVNQQTLEAILLKTDVCTFGLHTEDDLSIPLKESDRPVIVYNHRHEAYKCSDVTGEVLQTLRDEGFDFEVLATQYIDQQVSKIPADRIVGHPDRRQYLENIAYPAINTLNSVHETYCIAAVDSLALGHVLVAPNRCTFPELVPPDYPYLFRGPQEQAEMLREILRNWPRDFHAWSARLREHVRKHFLLSDYVARYAEEMHLSATLWHAQSMKAHVFSKVRDAFKAIPAGTYPLKDFTMRVRRKLNLGNQSFAGRRVIREAPGFGHLRLSFGGHHDILCEWRPNLRRIEA